MSFPEDSSFQDNEDDLYNVPISLTCITSKFRDGPTPILADSSTFHLLCDAASTNPDSTECKSDLLTDPDCNPVNFVHDSLGDNWLYPVPNNDSEDTSRTLQYFSTINQSFNKATPLLNDRSNCSGVEDSDELTHNPAHYFGAHITSSTAYALGSTDTSNHSSVENQPLDFNVFDLYSDSCATTALDNTENLAMGYSIDITHEGAQRLGEHGASSNADEHKGSYHVPSKSCTEVQAQLFLYAKRHAAERTRLISQDGHVTASNERLHVNLDSRIQIYPFANGMTLRFINCGLISKLLEYRQDGTKVSSKARRQDRIYHICLPVRGKIPARGSLYDGLPVFDYREAKHNGKHWSEFIARLEQAFGPGATIKCEKWEEADVVIRSGYYKKQRVAERSSVHTPPGQ